MRLWLGLMVLAVGCGRDAAPSAPPDDPEHPKMAVNEQERGLALCNAYVARVCACAETQPSLRDTCTLSKGQPEAVSAHLAVLNGAPLVAFGANGEAAGDGGAAADAKAGAKPAAATGKRPPLNENERRLTEGSLRKVIAACVELDAQLPASCPRR